MLDHDFKLKPSKQYIALLTIILITCLGIVIALPFANWLKSLGAALIIVYGGHLFISAAFLRGKYSITRLKYGNDGHWFLTTRQGVIEAKLRGDSTVTQVVTVLRFQIPYRTLPLSCVIFRDSLVTPSYRELLVVLRTMAKP